MAASQSIDIAQLPAWLEYAQKQLNVMTFEPALKSCKLVLIYHTKLNFQKQSGPNGQPWAPLKWRSGKALYDKGILIGSVTATGAGHVESMSDTTLIWGSNLEYAGTHQYGATIRPTSAKALAIPVTTEAKRSGGPRRMGELTLIWPKGKTTGRLADDAGQTQFVLVRSVTIPARPFIGWNEDMADECGQVVGAFAEKKLAS